MACGGLHCAGCAGGAGVAPVALAAAYGFVWVTEHLIEVAAVSVACAALAVYAVMRLKRWTERHDAERAGQGSLFVTRVDALPPRRQSAVAPPGRVELDAPGVHLHFHGLPDAEQAAVIRHALGRG